MHIIDGMNNAAIDFPDPDPEPHPCAYRCGECGRDMWRDSDCEACLAREQGTAEDLSELQERLADEDEIAELAIEEMDNA